MRKTMHLTAALLVLMLVLLPVAAAAPQVVDPTPVFYVADYANVLSDETEDYIVTQNDKLYALTGGQIVVVAIDFLGGQDIEEYAYTLMNDWGIGSAEHQNGLLLLLVIGEADYWGMAGTGLETALTASLVGSYMNDNLEVHFSAARYDEGVINTFDAFLGWYERYYNVSLNGAAGGNSLENPGLGGDIEMNSGDNALDPLETENGGAFQEGNIVGKVAGLFLVVVAILAVVVLTAIIVPKTVFLRRRGYHYSVFNRAFWRYNRLPPPPRRRYGHRPPHGGHHPGGPSHGGSRPGGLGMGGPRTSAQPRSSAPPPRSGGGGSTRGSGAGRSSFGGSSRPSGGLGGSSRPSGGRSSFGGGSRPSGGGGSRSGGGGGTRGGGAGRRK